MLVTLVGGRNGENVKIDTDTCNICIIQNCCRRSEYAKMDKTHKLKHQAFNGEHVLRGIVSWNNLFQPFDLSPLLSISTSLFFIGGPPQQSQLVS